MTPCSLFRFYSLSCYHLVLGHRYIFKHEHCKTLCQFKTCSFYFFFLVSCSHTQLLSLYVGQSLCIDIFSVYRSPESRIGDHPRNRLSHFYILQKWSGQDLFSVSLSLTGSPPASLFQSFGNGEQEHLSHTPTWDGWTESLTWGMRVLGFCMNGATLQPSGLGEVLWRRTLQGNTWVWEVGLYCMEYRHFESLVFD